MQQHAVHAQMDAPQTVVIAAAVAGVADDVMRDVMEMFADLPVAAGFRQGFDSRQSVCRNADLV